MIDRKVKTSARILFAIYMIALLILCLGRFHNLPGIKRIAGFETDKVVHFLMFIPFPVLVYYAFGREFRRWRSIILYTLAIFVFGCIFAACTELLQGFTSYRVADIGDFNADATGLAFTSIVVIIIQALRR